MLTLCYSFEAAELNRTPDCVESAHVQLSRIVYIGPLWCIWSAVITISVEAELLLICFWMFAFFFLHYHHSAMLLSYCFFWCRSLALHETPSLLLYFHTLSFALLQCIAGLTGNANILARKTVTALSALLLCLFLGVGERKKSEREPCFQDLEHQECRPCLESKTTSLKDSVKKEKVCLVQISPSRFCLSTTWNAQALNLNAICSPCLHKSKFTQSLHPTIGLCTVQQFLM